MDVPLHWMGPYREVVRALIRYANLYSHFQPEKRTDGAAIPLSAQEWQTLECIYEFEDQFYNMAALADKLGIPASNFSKYVKTLESHGLIDRYRIKDNRKSIILKLSPAGKEFYLKRIQLIKEEWASIFPLLDDLSAEEISAFVAFITEFGKVMDPNIPNRSHLQKL